jgi:tetraacyldisaccharide 4'-kinase
MALLLARLLRQAGRRPGFLTRGYGGAERGPLLADYASGDPARIGDEPLLLAAEAPTVVSRDRPAGARLLEGLDIDTIVMDDGFQNPTLHKDFNLVTIDGVSGLGSGQVFPLGPLRAPLAFQAALADAAVILDAPGKEPTKGRYNFPFDSLPVFHAGLVPQNAGEFRSGRYLAFCGIGRPQKFFRTLREAHIVTAATRSFPDHYPYSEKDARRLLDEAQSLEGGLVTTEKDLVRLKLKCGALADLRANSRALAIGVRFKPGEEALLLEAILTRIGKPQRPAGASPNPDIS